MPKFLPGAVEFGPNDVTSVKLTFHLDQIGYVELNIPDDGGEDRKFIRDLYRTAIDNYGPGGSNPTRSVGIQVIKEEDLV